ncbi:MAG: hypothetical protein LBD95_07280 [Clostridiales Family XIII bacterium]|jgi:predicted RNA-binding Zn-ribbon protein involved in translation (DUF1610 family)|nr:hypothetical protein [Clostridiales Family XIII bacterium]
MLKIPPDIELALSKDRITAAEAADAVKHCEDTRAKVFDAAAGDYTGYGESGAITLWVRYKTRGADAELLDYYFNRTRITGLSLPVVDPAARLGPLLEPLRSKRLLCCKCDVLLEPRKVLFRYANQNYHAVSFACPGCGQVYESKEIIRHQAEKVEALLEGK